jgi:hypothetical protein
MVVQGSLGEKIYSVGSALFPVLEIDEEGVRDVFQQQGFEPVAMEKCEKVSKHYFAVFKRRL